MTSDLSPKQVAAAMGVSEASLKRWCDRKLIAHVKTAGGHRRIPLHAVMRFLRQSGHELARPDLIGLPSIVGTGERTVAHLTPRIREALESGDADRFRSLVYGLYLAGHSLVNLCDDVLAPIFHDLGQRWERHDIEVYQERRACEIAARWLSEMSTALPPPPPGAPYAFGGTLEGDSYVLPSTMVELVLRELGWRAEMYGVCHPVDTLCAAVLTKRPAMVWISVSTLDAAADVASAWPALAAAAAQTETALVVGGRALTESVRRRLQYTAYCDQLSHLVNFVKSFGRVG